MKASDFINWPMDLRPKRGSFEMAKHYGRDPETGEQISDYEKTPCYLIGSIAVHRSINGKWFWKMSHAATGLKLPYAYGRNIKEACQVARAIHGAIDWTQIRRSKQPGKPRGVTVDRSSAIQATIYSFSFLSPAIDAARELAKA